MRILFSSTANDGHFGPLLPFVRACAAGGNEVRVAAPGSYGAALERVGLWQEPFADASADVIGPLMAKLMTMSVQEADETVVREVFGRIDAQAALPSLLETIERWRPQLVVRESAEVGALVAAERAGVPHVQVCIGMHEVAHRLADLMGEPLEELGRIAGLAEGRASAAMAAETIVSLVPELLDYASGEVLPGADAIRRFHQQAPAASGPRSRDWGDPDLPLVYVTFGSVAGSLPPFVGGFGEALEALAELDACVLMTTGRTFDARQLGPLPRNACVQPWVAQEEVLAHAAAMLGHGGFGTTMGALAAGVPQVVAPLFTFDQVINGERVAAVGAGLTTGRGPGNIGRATEAIPQLLREPSYAESARRVAAALRGLPPPSEAVPFLAGVAARP